MIKQPEHPLTPAFDKARDWAHEQERALTNAQRHVYDDIKSSQKRERQLQQERLDAFRAQLEEQTKKKKPKAELALNPPVRIKDPYLERQMLNILAAEKRIERLDQSHADQRIKALQEFENEREKPKAKPEKELTTSWQQALQKTARQENDRDDRRDLSKDFDKAR